jgi:hypothetical protein
MTRSNEPNDAAHDAVWDLLPWYVNESLDESELARVREHLHSCFACRQEVATQGQVRLHLHEAAPSAAQIEPAWQKMAARLQEETAVDAPVREVRRKAIPSWLGSWLQPAIHGRLAWAVAAALFAAASLPVLLEQWPAPPLKSFHTAAAPSSFSQFQPNDIRVVFNEPLSHPAILAIVEPLGGSIADGPAGPGVYTIRFEANPAEPDMMSRRLGQLRARKDIALAEPALPAAAPNQ